MNTQTTIPKRIAGKVSAPLNTPLKRAAAIALATGIALLLYGVVDMENDCCSKRDIVENIWRALMHDRYTMMLRDWARPVRWGSFLVVLGFFLSYGYDRTIGKIVSWVREG